METTKVVVDNETIELVMKLDEDKYEENLNSYDDIDLNSTMEIEINE